ncbi:MAG: aminotransferase class IV [Bacteroidales bacterium]|nr:aminotransferase class IV [Bacteroidales bacterium]
MEAEFFISNGVLKRSNEPEFKINNRAFLFGDGFFESIIAFNHNIPFLDLHLKRINQAIKIFQFTNFEIFINPTLLKEQIIFLARKNKLYKTYKIRITIFRESGGLFKPTSNKLNYIIQTQKLNVDKFEFDRRGLKIDIYDEVKINYSPFSKFKTLNSLPYIFAQQFALEHNLDDVFLLNHKNNIVETSNSNVFLLVDNKVFTPSIDCGCVEGISRHIIINILYDLNIPITQTSINLELVNSATEIFLSNAIKGVQKVLAFQAKRYSSMLSSKILKLLNEKFYI